MPQEILLYGQVYAKSSIDFINGISAVSEDDDLVVRINTNGGDVLFGWGMVAKFNEFKGVKKIKVDGSAYSMGAYFLAYADAENIEALDVSDFLIHRAGFPNWYEDNYMSESEKENLKTINSSLHDALKNRIDVNKFKEISGKTLKEVFSMDGRIDVFLTAQQAKQIGLIGKITKITPTKKAEISAINQRIAANYTGGKNQNTNFNPSKMTKEEFKKEHPEAYVAIVNEGITAERDRCGAYLAYITADKDAVIAGIKSGEPMSATAQAELNIKIVQAMNAAVPKVDADGNPIVEAAIPAIETPATPLTPTAKTELDKVRDLLAPKKTIQ